MPISYTIQVYLTEDKSFCAGKNTSPFSLWYNANLGMYETTEKHIEEEEMGSSEEKEIQSLSQTLAGYKEKIPPVNKSTITWERDLIFHGRTQRGEEIDYDAEFQWGCSPTESLLLSIGGCLAIDVVSFLQKMRCEITKFKMDLSGERNLDPPQYYKSVELVMHISGENITPKKVDRAISLSQEKYCSVYHSLRPDIGITVRYEIE